MKCFSQYSYFILLSLFITSVSACKKDKITPPIVTTANVSEITWTTATSGGDVTNNGGATVIERGVCWNVSANPTISNSRTIEGGNTGSYISALTSLSPNTKYYVRAYATNSAGTGYGNEVNFTTSQMAAATITTTAITEIATTTAVSGGNISSDGGSSVTVRGVCWSMSANPVITGLHTSDGSGSGSFISALSGLSPNTTYYVRAYAVNSVGTVYGNEVTFKTNQITLPVLITSSATNITSTTAVSGGNITSSGGGNISAKGVCWAASANPTIANDKTSDGTGSGAFTSNITDLKPGTLYHLRGFATNEAGTAYGNEITFTTVAVLPTLTTTAISGLTTISAISGGNITDNGGSAVTSRGVCWSTISGSTVSGSHTSDGTGNGIYTSSITGLTANTTYYVRAYAVNSIGTAYGNEIIFITNQVTVPSLMTTEASSVTSTTAVSGGTITNDGGGTILERGVCWSTVINPTVVNSKTSEFTGSNTFICNIPGLTPGTTYHLRAYAANSAGITYGNDVTFTTPGVLPVLTTLTVSDITQTSAISGGTISSDGGSAITARGICWGTNVNPTMTGEYSVDGAGIGSFSSSMRCLTHSTSYYVRAYATNSIGTAYGNQLSFTTVPIDNPIIFNPNLTYGTVSDVDGNCYKTIQIGIQTWMAENLKTTKYNDGTIIPLVTDNSEWANLTTPGYCWHSNDEATNKNVYGALYNWYAVNTGKLCPVGWRASNNFHQVYVVNGKVEGGRMKEAGFTHWQMTELNSPTNESGFTALPAGDRNIDGRFSLIGSMAIWWDEAGAFMESAYVYWIIGYMDQIESAFTPMRRGCSVRCLKDN